MSKQVEYRVRPVIRYVVTRFENGSIEGGGSYGGSECVGEYPNEGMAERAMTALRDVDPDVESINGYVVVRLTQDVLATDVWYAQTLSEAIATRDREEARTGNEWMVAKRYVRKQI